MGKCKKCGAYTDNWSTCSDCKRLNNFVVEQEKRGLKQLERENRIQEEREEEEFERERVLEKERFEREQLEKKLRQVEELLQYSHSIIRNTDPIPKKIEDLRLLLGSNKIDEKDSVHFIKLVNSSEIFRDAFFTYLLDPISEIRTEEILFARIGSVLRGLRKVTKNQDKKLNSEIVSRLQSWLDSDPSDAGKKTASILLQSAVNQILANLTMDLYFYGKNDFLTFNGFLAGLTFGTYCFCPNCKNLSKQNLVDARKEKSFVQFEQGAIVTKFFRTHSKGLSVSRTCSRCISSWEFNYRYPLLFIPFVFFLYLIVLPVISLFESMLGG